MNPSRLNLRITPDKRLISALVGLLLLGLLVGFFADLKVVWLGLAFFLSAVALSDLLMLFREPSPGITRRVQPVMPVMVPSNVTLSVSATSSRSQSLELSDVMDGHVSLAKKMLMLVLTPDREEKIVYQITPRKRGLLKFYAVEFRLKSPFGFWAQKRRIPLPDSVRILPDFMALGGNQVSLDVMIRHQQALRIVRQRGMGTEFHQIRDYQPDDSPSSIDWAATAKGLGLKSREYQAERGQQVILLLDCSRRMRSEDEGIAHFDACLMSAVRLAQAAQIAGDHVGCLTFGGVNRWLKPMAGNGTATVLLNQLFDVAPTLEAPDYVAAAKTLLTRQQRRALVVLISNMKDEDNDELLTAARLISRRHLLMIASLREQLLDDVLHTPVTDFRSSLRYLSTSHYTDLREGVQKRFEQQYKHVVDATAEELGPKMIARYMAIKQAAQL